jgi:hypothetical protein
MFDFSEFKYQSFVESELNRIEIRNLPGKFGYPVNLTSEIKPDNAISVEKTKRNEKDHFWDDLAQNHCVFFQNTRVLRRLSKFSQDN